MELTLFSDAERAEDQVEDVVGSGGAGDFIQRTQSAIEVEQEHLVGNFLWNRSPSFIQRANRVGDQLLLAHIGQEAALALSAAISAD